MSARKFIFRLFLGLLFFLGSFSATKAKEVFEISGISMKTEKVIRMSPQETRLGLVLVFLSPECPCSLSHEAHLKSLAEKYSGQGFQFLGVHSNADESFTEAKAHFDSANLPFEIISDPESKIANKFKALSTPQAFVISPDSQIVFLGGVSNSSKFSPEGKQYLADALEAVSKAKLPAVQQARALGCQIRRP